MKWASLLAVAALAAPAPPQGPGPYPSPAETRAEFQAICDRLRQGDDPFFGQASVPWLEERLRASPPPERRVQLQVALGLDLLRLGREEEAIALLERALAAEAAGSPARPPLQFHLALAHLRLAEVQNCMAMTGVADRCILPFSRDAVQARPEHGRIAGDLLLAFLRDRPGNARARWLLNVSRMAVGDYPAGVPGPLRLPTAALESEASLPRWRNVAPALGVDAFDLAGGGLMDDFDGDGLLDLVSSSMDPCAPLKAFRNDGRGGFEDVSEAWGLSSQLGGLNLVHADYDGDGMLDILVLRGGWMGENGAIRRSLLRNDLKRPARRFVDVTAAAGLASPAYPSQTAAWADFDGDGDLDLYVGNETRVRAGLPTPGPPPPGRPSPSQLFRNDGDGTFTDVAPAAGVTNERFAKGVAAGDYDNDGRPDLYVSNIGPNRLYHNDGDGTFTDLAPRLGVVEPAGRSFATWFFDYDNDGDLDLWVNDYGEPYERVFAAALGEPAASGHPLLYRNDLERGGGFTEVSAEAGLTRPVLPMGSNHGDLDNDGWLDVYLGTGVPDLAALMPNAMYRNDAGRRFQDVTAAGGFGHLQKGHGIAFGDLDNDGDQDLFEQMGGAFPSDAFANVLYENPGPAQRWITLRLIGERANRSGIGARIEVRAREGDRLRSVHALVGSGGSFGGSSLQQEIGLGAASGIESITIRWPGSGTVQVFRNVAPNRAYAAVEGEPELEPLDLPRLQLGKSPHGKHEHR